VVTDAVVREALHALVGERLLACACGHHHVLANGRLTIACPCPSGRPTDHTIQPMADEWRMAEIAIGTATGIAYTQYMEVVAMVGTTVTFQWS
jgi:hypothetical protein